MNVGELRNFLSTCDQESNVTLLQCSNDNPMDDDVEVKDAVVIRSIDGSNKIVLVPC